MTLRESILNTLAKEVIPATGCTEPVAIALATAKVMEGVKEELVEELILYVSPNVFKNGMGVGIPGSRIHGLDMAAALGYVIKRGDKGLKIFEEVTPEYVKQAEAVLERKKVHVALAKTDEKIYIEANLKMKSGSVQLVISGRHNHISKITVNGEVVLEDQLIETVETDPAEHVYSSAIESLIRTIETMEYEELSFLVDGMEMNLSIAEYGLKNRSGMAVGATLNDKVQSGILSKDLMNTAMILTASASDARMAGVNMPVMSSNGSGNNGLTAVLPLAAYYKLVGGESVKIAKALAISHVINCYIKKRIGRLSSLCGCSIAAATGAAAALSWMMNGSMESINGTIQNMIADVSGMICDGAKSGCALKLSTSAAVAVKYALLGSSLCVVPAHNGIIGTTVEETIDNLGRLSNEGMKVTDKIILDIMAKMSDSKRVCDLN